MKKPNFNKIDQKALNNMIGITIIIFSLVCLLNIGPIANFFTYLSVFLFGIGYFIIFLILLFWGIGFIFPKIKIKFRFNFIFIGLILLFLSLLIILSNSFHSEFMFKDFKDKFLINFATPNFPVPEIEGGGIIGYFFIALINSSGMGQIGTYIIGSLLLLIGLFFVFGQLIYRYIIHLKMVKIEFNNEKDKTESIIDVSNIANENKIKNIERVNEDETTKLEEENVLTSNLEVNEEIKEDIFPAFQQYESNFEPNNELHVANFFSQFNDDKSENLELKVEEINNSNDEKTNINNMSIKELASSYLKNNDDYSTINLNNSNNFTDNKEENEVSKNIEEINNGEIFLEEISNNNDIKRKGNNYKEELIDNSHSNKERVTNIYNYKEEVFNNDHRNFSTENLIETSPQPIIKEKNKIKPKKFIPPDINLLDDRRNDAHESENITEAEIKKAKINEVLRDFSFGGEVISFTIGPSVTRFDLEMNRGVSVKGFEKYLDDISMKLDGLPIRFEPIILGKTTSGIEVPNKRQRLVNFKDILKDMPKVDEKNKLLISFGQDIGGSNVFADLRKFPHLLVSGTTGSGKSVFIHSLILPLIMRNHYDDVKLVLIDPKKVEFSKYSEIPHLLCPIIIDPQQAYNVLNELVYEMEDRYEKFSNLGTNEITEYNEIMAIQNKEKMPFIVVVIDEYADLVESQKNISTPVVRIAQKARAAGIHLIVATQRPTTNIVTGTIKANIPTRVALLCSSNIDSQTILDVGGAEKLLGNGDMLVKCSLISRNGFPRIQGSFLDNKEIFKVAQYLRDTYEPCYDEKYLDIITKSKMNTPSSEYSNAFDYVMENNNNIKDDPKYQMAKEFAMHEEYISVSKIQNYIQTGFPKADKILKMLITEGIVSGENTGNSNKGKKVLIRYNEQGEIYKEEDVGSVEQSYVEPIN